MNSTTTTFNPPRSFGVFAPIGYLVIAFPGEAEATKAREALLTGGYEEDEALMFSSQQVISDIENTRADISMLAYMGRARAPEAAPGVREAGVCLPRRLCAHRAGNGPRDERRPPLRSEARPQVQPSHGRGPVIERLPLC